MYVNEKRIHNTFKFAERRPRDNKFFENKAKYEMGHVAMFRIIFSWNKMHWSKILPIFLYQEIVFENEFESSIIFASFFVGQHFCRIYVLCAHFLSNQGIIQPMKRPPFGKWNSRCLDSYLVCSEAMTLCEMQRILTKESEALKFCTMYRLSPCDYRLQSPWLHRCRVFVSVV